MVTKATARNTAHNPQAVLSDVFARWFYTNYGLSPCYCLLPVASSVSLPTSSSPPTLTLLRISVGRCSTSALKKKSAKYLVQALIRTYIYIYIVNFPYMYLESCFLESFLIFVTVKHIYNKSFNVTFYFLLLISLVFEWRQWQWIAIVWGTFYFLALSIYSYRYKFYSSILFVIRVEGIEDPRGIRIPGWCSISEVTSDRERIIIGTHTLYES